MGTFFCKSTNTNCIQAKAEKDCDFVETPVVAELNQLLTNSRAKTNLAKALYKALGVS